MNQPKSQITHYIPEWMLWKFRVPALYELDILTGKTELRAPKKAGSGRDLWPNDIEDRLSKHDNAAARIYREKMHGQPSIALTNLERRAFALWLAYFYVRSPKRLAFVEEFLKQEKHNREELVQDLYEDAAASIDRIRSGNPFAYANTVAELGEVQANKIILAHYAHGIRTTPMEKIGKTSDFYHNYMRNCDVEKYAQILLRYHWVWLSSHHGFVIGDDPLVSWHLASRKWEYGIAREGVEVTMPIALNLCLCLQQQPMKQKMRVQPISKMEARLLDCRQRLAATKYVFGSAPGALDFIEVPIVGWP